MLAALILQAHILERAVEEVRGNHRRIGRGELLLLIALKRYES